MNHKKKMLFNGEGYEAPAVQVLDIAVEQGFTASGKGNIEDGKVDNWGDY